MDTLNLFSVSLEGFKNAFLKPLVRIGRSTNFFEIFFDCCNTA